MKKRNNWFVRIALVVIIAVAAATYVEMRRCDGRLVRGLIWWECVER